MQTWFAGIQTVGRLEENTLKTYGLARTLENVTITAYPVGVSRVTNGHF